MTSQTFSLHRSAFNPSMSLAMVPPVSRLDTIVRREIGWRTWDRLFVLVTITMTVLTALGIGV